LLEPRFRFAIATSIIEALRRPVETALGWRMAVCALTPRPRSQPVSKLVTITRTASRRLEHPLLEIIGFLQGSETFDQPPGALAGAAQGPQEQKDCECGDTVAEWQARPC